MTDRSRLLLAWILLIVGIAAVVAWYLQLRADTPRITFEPVPGFAKKPVETEEPVKMPRRGMTNVPPTAASGTGMDAR